MTRVLVVDDEPQMLRALRVTLAARKFDVMVAEDGTRALERAAEWPPDLVILDLGLPDMDGVDVIAGMRGWMQAPIIVLSGRTTSNDKVMALDAGADDYVTKPFAMDELLARMRAVLRRKGKDSDQARVVIGDYSIDLGTHRVRPTDPDDVSDDVRLTPTEWRVLEVLVKNSGRLVTQRQLLAEVWGPAYTKETGYLRLYLAQLRRKLEREPSRPKHLLTEPGIGYRFVE